MSPGLIGGQRLQARAAYDLKLESMTPATDCQAPGGRIRFLVRSIAEYAGPHVPSGTRRAGVRDYDEAIRFFVDVLQAEDTPSLTNDGRPKRWVVVRPAGGQTGVRAAGVQFVSPPRDEPYGRLAVFLDLEGNQWDLLGSDPRR